MKPSKSTLIFLAILVIVASVYRVIDRPMGFAPQIAMALFAGMVVKNRVWAFFLPVLSMVFSDLVYEILFINGLTTIQGFYNGQITNYILLASVVLVGFLFKKVSVVNVIAGSLIAPTYFFLVSNFVVWVAGAGYQHPKTFAGLLLTYEDAIPFYRNSIAATLFFSAILFGVYVLVKKSQKKAVA